MSLHTGRSAASKEPHFMQDESYVREQRDLEHDLYMQDLEDSAPRPSYSNEGSGE